MPDKINKAISLLLEMPEDEEDFSLIDFGDAPRVDLTGEQAEKWILSSVNDAILRLDGSTEEEELEPMEDCVRFPLSMIEMIPDDPVGATGEDTLSGERLERLRGLFNRVSSNHFRLLQSLEKLKSYITG